MKTIALRFGDSFAPAGGTINAHNEIIEKLGYVWYGKFGTAVSNKVTRLIMDNPKPRVLLIHSGTSNRYWAYIDAISRIQPDKHEFPSYYRDKAGNIKTWLKIIGFERAESDIMSKLIVVSSGSTLAETSKHSMSPYFIIDCKEVVTDD